jgi:hypothetical protein
MKALAIITERSGWAVFAILVPTTCLLLGCISSSDSTATAAGPGADSGAEPRRIPKNHRETAMDCPGRATTTPQSHEAEVSDAQSCEYDPQECAGSV